MRLAIHTASIKDGFSSIGVLPNPTFPVRLMWDNGSARTVVLHMSDNPSADELNEASNVLSSLATFFGDGLDGTSHDSFLDEVEKRFGREVAMSDDGDVHSLKKAGKTTKIWAPMVDGKPVDNINIEADDEKSAAEGMLFRFARVCDENNKLLPSLTKWMTGGKKVQETKNTKLVGITLRKPVEKTA